MRVESSLKICQSCLHSPLGGTAAVKRWNVRSEAENTPSCSPQDVPGNTTSAKAVVWVMKMSWEMSSSRFSRVSFMSAESGSVCSGSSPKL